MIKSFSCVNIFAKDIKETTAFYRDVLAIPVMGTIVDDDDGVNFGFIKDAPTICIWDAKKWGAPIQGTLSLVFLCDDLDATCEDLIQKGLVFDPPVQFDWGTYELRLQDPDGNEVVVAALHGQTK